MVSCVGTGIIPVLPFRFEPMRSQCHRGILPNPGIDRRLGITLILGFYGLIQCMMNWLSFGSVNTCSSWPRMVLGRSWTLQFWTRVKNIQICFVASPWYLWDSASHSPPFSPFRSPPFTRSKWHGSLWLYWNGHQCNERRWTEDPEERNSDLVAGGFGSSR